MIQMNGGTKITATNDTANGTTNITNASNGVPSFNNPTTKTVEPVLFDAKDPINNNLRSDQDPSWIFSKSVELYKNMIRRYHGDSVNNNPVMSVLELLANLKITKATEDILQNSYKRIERISTVLASTVVAYCLVVLLTLDFVGYPLLCLTDKLCCVTLDIWENIIILTYLPMRKTFELIKAYISIIWGPVIKILCQIESGICGVCGSSISKSSNSSQ